MSFYGKSAESSMNIGRHIGDENQLPLPAAIV
jgi:hypothetical protein